MTTPQSLAIAVLPGDGIGREVMASCLALLDATEAACGGPRLALTVYDAGAQFYAESGDALPEATLAACRDVDAILFGAMGWPDIRHLNGTEIISQLDLRMALSLYAGVRPVRCFPGSTRVLFDERARGIDVVLVREQTEGLFHARGRGRKVGDRAAYDTMQITRDGTERICAFAFAIAERRRAASGKPRRVTCVDKANVFTSMAFFRKVFDEVANRHPQIGRDHAYVDAMAIRWSRTPDRSMCWSPRTCSATSYRILRCG